MFHQKILFTPGPLATTKTVKKAMLYDMGARDEDLVHVIKYLRLAVLEVIKADPSVYTPMLLQGPATFANESVLTSISAPNSNWLVLTNGMFGTRLAEILTANHISCTKLEFASQEAINYKDVEKYLAEHHSEITHIAMVHHETSTGMIHDIERVGRMAAKYNKTFMVDAVSSYGAIPIDMQQMNIDFLVTTPNKCMSGLPGFAIIIANKQKLAAQADYPRSYSLNLKKNFDVQDHHGRIRFIPPVQALLAFQVAIQEWKNRGGLTACMAKCKRNYRFIKNSIAKLGFTFYLPPKLQGYIITRIYYPKNPNFDRKNFLKKLYELGFVVYGSEEEQETFRIGHMGNIGAKENKALLAAIQSILVEMRIN